MNKIDKQILFEQQLKSVGYKEYYIENGPCIEIDCSIEEYARINGYLNQEEYNNLINNIVAFPFFKGDETIKVT